MAANTTHHKIAQQLFAESSVSFLLSTIKDSLDDVDSHFFVACSGGADSVFLLYWTFEYMRSRELPLNLDVLHFNHCLRGEESDEDERFVREICLNLGLPLHVSRWDRLDSAEPASEAEARSARFQFFQSVCSNFSNPIVMTGHHGGDVVETMLMRLSRGSGSVGLSAPRPISDPGYGFKVLRPLLALERSGLCDTLNQAGGRWREDRSNKSDRHYRNRMRNNVIPEWENASDRDILPGVLLARKRLEEDSDALESWLDTLWGELSPQGDSIELEMFCRLEPALQRRAIDRMLKCSISGISFDVGHWSLLQKGLNRGENSVISLSDSVRFVLDQNSGKIYIETDNKRIEWSSFILPTQEVAFLPDGSRIEAKWVEVDTELLSQLKKGQHPHSRVVFLKVKHTSFVSVRSWRHGDNYKPNGLDKRKKVSKLFIDRKVPLDLRYRLPFFVSNREEILWVPNLPPNQSYLVDHNTTHALQLTYKAFDVTS